MYILELELYYCVYSRTRRRWIDDIMSPPPPYNKDNVICGSDDKHIDAVIDALS